jgi:hypothetical protein
MEAVELLGVVLEVAILKTEVLPRLIQVVAVGEGEIRAA